MQITDEMVHVALKKSVEAGLLPRHPPPDEAAQNREVIRGILAGVMELIQQSRMKDSSS
ncbi:MAG: hypothetical protein JWQ23_3086 [Herminiimonas sp.]|jgi:hypothetical protein|nr:hypothetical protein [Herminiimonas sp.]